VRFQKENKKRLLWNLIAVNAKQAKDVNTTVSPSAVSSIDNQAELGGALCPTRIDKKVSDVLDEKLSVMVMASRDGILLKGKL
jgi:hypothetical protein